MVHALKEAYRVLVPNGIMIDLRPLCIDVPLEIVYEGGSESAGILDLSPDIDRDITSDVAIVSVIKGGLFLESKVEYFDYAYYWETIKGMEEDLEENWKDEVIVSEEVRQRASVLFDKQCPQTQIRFAVRMKLGTYIKL